MSEHKGMEKSHEHIKLVAVNYLIPFVKERYPGIYTFHGRALATIRHKSFNIQIDYMKDLKNDISYDSCTIMINSNDVMNSFHQLESGCKYIKGFIKYYLTETRKEKIEKLTSM